MGKKIIHTTIIPWIMSKGSKTPEEAKFFITKKQEPINNQENKQTKNEYLSSSIGEKVYNNDKNYEFDLNNNVIILAKPNGITEGKVIILLDKTLDTFKSYTNDEILIKLNTTMAICGAKKGIYYIQKLNKKISIDFDSKMWETTLNKVKTWSEGLH